MWLFKKNKIVLVYPKYMLQSGCQTKKKIHICNYWIFLNGIFAGFNTHMMAGLAAKEYRILWIAIILPSEFKNFQNMNCGLYAEVHRYHSPIFIFPALAFHWNPVWLLVTFELLNTHWLAKHFLRIPLFLIPDRMVFKHTDRSVSSAGWLSTCPLWS